MDLFDDPELKKTYEKCKYIVKVWEHKFTKKYKRIPSKLDIREAAVEVRHAYRKYFQLKTAALEQSFMDIEGFDEEISENLSQNLENREENDSAFQFQLSNDKFTEDCSNENSEVIETIIKEAKNVETENSFQTHNKTQSEDNTWGSHLNKKISPAQSENAKKDKAPSKPVQSISKKLFCGSKFNKRNPRKSLSFSQKKNSEISFESPIFFSQTEPSLGIFKSEEALSGLEPEIRSSFLDKSVKIVESVNKTIAQPVSINIIDSVLQNKQKGALTRVDSGWLKRVAENTGVSLENSELSSQTFSHSLSLPDNNKNHSEALETKVDYDSDDIIEDSDEEQNTSRNISLFHIAKKSRISLNSEFRQFPLPNQQVIEKKTVTTSITNLQENITNNIPPEGITGTTPEISKTSDSLSKDEVSHVKKQDSITTENKNKEFKLGESLEKLNLDDQFPMKKNKKAVSKKQNNKTPRKRKSASKQKITNTPEANKSNNVSPLRRSSRKNKVKASFEELSSGEEDPFASDNDDKDPEFVLEEEKGTKKGIDVFNFKEIEEEFDKSLEVINKPPKGRKKTRQPVSEKSVSKRSLKAKKEDQNPERETSEASAKYELEFNVKPRIMAPRYGSITKVIRKKIIENSKESMEDDGNKEEITSLPKNKKQQAKEKLEKKIASGNLNDNFVTINLRKKIFVKGKKGHNFSKYKKAMWKNKKKALYGPDMDMGGCDGGKLTCFNCGQEGHFAQKCKAGKGDGLLPLTGADNAESECPFPTLEDASKMAAESVLRIRKPKILVQKDKNETDSPDIEKHNDSNENDLQSDEDWLEDIDEEILLAEATKLEEHVRKLDVQSYMDNVKVVEPYYKLKADEDVIDTPSEVFETLSLFGHNSFRQGQNKAIMRILSGKSTLVTLSTGSGKSLCYQLPAYLYSLREPCITLVISPLVSLMEDQVTGIPKFLKAACLHTNQTPATRQRIMEALTCGDINILLISPEAVVAGEKQTGFGSILRKLPPIAFACIDEAHCVSQWSHNFRPSYLMICRVLRESLGVKTILGLTATATRATCESIITSLDIPDGLEGIISDIPLPDNLHLTVSKDANRERALLNLLLSERFKNCKSIIVYCTRREECERVAAFLRTSLKSEVVVESTNKKRKRLNLQAEPYHAGLSASRRRTVQNAFMSGDLRIVVATVAFGMGINKSDIRAVIHFNMPNSFESYVQEVGRAGRDGLPAHCHVFLDSQGRDENELRRHIHANSIDRHVIRKLLQKIFIPCSCKGLCPKHEVAFSIERTVRALDIPEENISTLLCYLELHENKYIELLNPAYTTCKVISYGGPLQIRKAAKECPPLAMALALHPSKEGEENILEFPVVDVASAMGWDSGICKHKLKNLEWTAVNNQPKRSTLTVQFSNLGFRLLAPGNLNDERLDQALDSLYNRVVNQESKALKQLRAVHRTLSEVAEKSYRSCVNVAEDNGGNNVLKEKIRGYFNSSDPLADMGKESPININEDQLINDVRAMICMYRDNQFTGRAIARIFHGIQSPNYPAVMWGRCKFWRAHLSEDFNEICRIATREIIRMR